MALNLISSIVVFAVQMLINFLLAPFILRSLGDEGYGLLSLANSIVAYTYILTMVVNSVVGRFVAYEYHKGNLLLASKYYSSVLVINIIFSVFICLSSAIFIFYLEHFINVSKELYIDAQITFGLYFTNFCLGLFNAMLCTMPFIANKIYLIAVRSAISSVIFAFCIFGFYYFLKPMIAYAACSALIASIFVFFSSLIIVKRLNLGVKFRIKLARLRLLIALLKSGIWNSFNSLSYNIINGVDILLCNLLLSPVATGILAISKALILTIESFIAMLSNIFSPKFVEFYAKKDIRALLKEIRFAIKVEAFISLTPICVFITLGSEFYTLWLPFKSSLQIHEIYILAMISAVPALLLACMYPLLNTNIVANKLRRPVIANFIMAVFSISLQFLALKYTDYGLYAMFVIASFSYTCKILIFDITNSARNLKLPKFTFFKDFFANLFIFILLGAYVFMIKSFFSVNSWLDFVIVGLILVLFSYTFCLFAIFDKEQKKLLFAFIKQKISRGKK